MLGWYVLGTLVACACAVWMLRNDVQVCSNTDCAVWMLRNDVQVCSNTDCEFCNDWLAAAMRKPPGSVTYMAVDHAVPGKDTTVMMRIDAQQMGKRQKAYQHMKEFLESGGVIIPTMKPIKNDMADIKSMYAFLAPKVLEEQGASPQYIEKVKAELCGPFGRVMNHG